MKITKSKRFWAMVGITAVLSAVTFTAIFKEMETVASIAVGGIIAEALGYFSAETLKKSKK